MADGTVTMRYQARDPDEIFTFLRETYPDRFASAPCALIRHDSDFSALQGPLGNPIRWCEC